MLMSTGGGKQKKHLLQVIPTICAGRNMLRKPRALTQPRKEADAAPLAVLYGDGLKLPPCTQPTKKSSENLG